MKFKRIICLLLVIVLLPLPAPTIFAADDVVPGNFEIAWFNDDGDGRDYDDSFKYLVYMVNTNSDCTLFSRDNTPIFVPLAGSTATHDADEYVDQEHVRTTVEEGSTFAEFVEKRLYPNLQTYTDDNEIHVRLHRGGKECDAGPSSWAGLYNLKVDTSWLMSGEEPSIGQFKNIKKAAPDVYKQLSDNFDNANRAVYYPVRVNADHKRKLVKLLQNSTYSAIDTFYKLTDSGEVKISDIFGSDTFDDTCIYGCDDQDDDASYFLININLRDVNGGDATEAASYFRFYVLRDFYAAAVLRYYNITDSDNLLPGRKGEQLITVDATGSTFSRNIGGSVKSVAEGLIAGMGVTVDDYNNWSSKKSDAAYSKSYAALQDTEFDAFLQKLLVPASVQANTAVSEDDAEAAESNFQEAHDIAESGDEYDHVLFNAAASLYNITSATGGVLQVGARNEKVNANRPDETLRRLETIFPVVDYNVENKAKLAAITGILSQSISGYDEAKRKEWFDKFKEYCDYGSVDASESTGVDVIGLEEEALRLLEEVGDNIDMSQTEYRMMTWEARCKYWLSRIFQKHGSDNPYDSSFEAFAKAAYPDLYYIHPGVLDCRLAQENVKIADPQAYAYFIGAVLEAEFMVRYALTLTDIRLDDSEDSLNKLKEYVSQIQPVYETLVWLTSSDGQLKSSRWRELMTKKLTGCDYTLQEVYDYIERHNLLSTHGAVTINDPDQPLTEFFGLDDKVVSGDIQEGIAYSATYVPMSTNVYDAYTLAEQDSEFLKNFHYKYGFYRKALYRDTNVDAAVDTYTTGNVGDLKVCTLRDFLDNAGDTVLYIDDNFYNANVLAEKLDMTYNRLDNKDTETDTRPWYQRLWSTITDWFTVDIYEITKTAEETRYSEKLADKTGKESEQYRKDEDPESETNEEEYVLKSSQIDKYIPNCTEYADTGEIVYEDYDPMFSFAVVSAIYRFGPLFKFANKDACYKPVYVSSEKLACIKGTNTQTKGSLWNYALQRNLLSNAPIGYTYNVDMNQPLYMDVYGNILTESGVVVVPAASNMTLFDGDYYQDCYSMGLWLVYGDNYSVPTDFENIEDYMSVAFDKDETTHSWIPKARTIGDGTADFARLTTGDKSVNYDVYSFTLHNLRSKKYVFPSYVGIILEVLRGAPIDYIDKNFEALNTDHRLSEAGLVAAARFEELQGALKSANGNAMLSIPNPAFTDGFEYIALFAFKIMVIISIVIMLITIFIDVIRATLSFKTFGHCLGVVAMLILVIVSIPVIFQVTYYQTNRALLQDEAARIAMLNEEQRMAGTEIGVYTVNEVKGGTEMLLKLEDLKIPWWDLFYKVVMSDVIDEMEELMKDYTTEALTGDMPNVTVKNSGVYMSINDLFDTADVELNLASKQLYLRTDEMCTASFFSPYYVIAESLIYNINNYNKANNWYSYTTKEQRGGKLRTIGLAKAYFTSTDFMDAEGDLLYLDEAHGVVPSLVRACPFKKKELKQMENALWTQQFLNEDEIMERNEIITQDAKEFIAANRDLLGRISDETFIKVMALTLAMKHNDLYAVDAANCFELYDLSQEDITRLSIAPDWQVMQNSTLNYARFVYEVGGTTAVYAAAFKSLIEWVGSYIKPLVTIAVFILIFSSIFVFKIVLRKESSNYYGYIITTLLLCAANAAHALLLKLSMYLPKLNLSATVCLLLETVCEIAYMCILGWVCYVAVKDWRNVGAERYAMTGFKIMDKIKNPGRDGVHGRMPKDNWQFFNKLKDNHDKRNGYSNTTPIIKGGGGSSSKHRPRSRDTYYELVEDYGSHRDSKPMLDIVEKERRNRHY